MTVVYASDERYVPLMLTSAVSVLRCNPRTRIVLLGYGLSDKARSLVRDRVESHSGTFAYYDVDEKLRKLEEGGCQEYTSYAAYARVFIPEFQLEEGRVLYLDCDTLVQGPLDALFRMDLKGRPFALAGDCIHRAYRRYIGLPDGQPYYNSGVMVMDLGQWRAHRCTERVLEELKNPHGPNPLGDQDVIVRCFPDETAPLPPKWNVLSQYLLVSYKGLSRIVGKGGMLPFAAEDYEEARKYAVIWHFSGHTLGRPWFKGSKHPMRERYREAAREAGFASAAEQDRPVPREYLVQYWLYRLLPQPLFDIACSCLYRLHIWRTYHA